MTEGTVALIGSGELSGTMVETHKKLFSKIASQGKALFLNTPAGFQENVDLIARRATDFFFHRVGQNVEVASFKSAASATTAETEQVFRLLSEAGFVLIGPGSPTYTVRQLKETPIPTLLSAMVTRGGSLVVASAAALTAGSHTLPVYEIYKVGEPLHWIEGLNILGNLGLEVVVIPHWNNAEGGNHDTRFCYMGKKRFHSLESMLPEDTVIIGIDEHTACILDFAAGNAVVEGIGQVTIRRNGSEQRFKRNEHFTFEQLLYQSFDRIQHQKPELASRPSPNFEVELNNQFWNQIHDIESAFNRALEENELTTIITLLLETDKLLWQAQLDMENPEFISQGRELYHEMIVLAGTGIERTRSDIPHKFIALLDALVELREQYRRDKRWSEADEIRSILQNAGVTLEDTKEGPLWRFQE